MCGSLKFEGISRSVGDILNIRLISEHVTTRARWNGFIRQEMKDWWEKQGGLKPCLVPASSFVEGNPNKKLVEVSTHSGFLFGVYLTKNVVSNGAIVGHEGDVKVFTRVPANDFERDIHHRWPISLMKGKKAQEWTPRDVVVNI